MVAPPVIEDEARAEARAGGDERAVAAASPTPSMRCTFSAGSGTRESRASFAMRKLLSGWSGATVRSSPKKTWTLGQLTCVR